MDLVCTDYCDLSSFGNETSCTEAYLDGAIGDHENRGSVVRVRYKFGPIP